MATKATDFLHQINPSLSFQHLKPLHALITVHGGLQTHHNNTLINHFLTSCLTLNLPHFALSAFLRLENPTLASAAPLIKSLAQRGLNADVLRVVSHSGASAFSSAGEFALSSFIKACAGLGAERSGREAHCVALRAGFARNVVVQTALLDLYSKCGRVGNARDVLEGIPRPDLVAWNAVIAGFSRNGMDGEAAAVFGRVLGVGLRPNLSTLASVIPVFTRLRCIEIGECLHGYAVKSGYFAGGFLVPALISMYAGESDLRSVGNLFDSAVERSISVWNAFIFAYVRMKMPIEAIFTFSLMLENAVQPNLITFVSVIPACEDEDGRPLGESLHAFAIKHGSENRLPVLAALVSMYAKLGDVGSAECIFRQMPCRDQLSWNSLISGYVHNGLWESSLAAFREMRFSGQDPDEVSVISIISACAKLEAISLGESAHAFSLRTGFGSFLNLSNALLAFYAGFHQPSCVKLFGEMPARSTVSWNTLISSFAHDRETAAGMATSVLRQMEREGVRTDLVTLISILSIFSESESLGQRKAIHCKAIKAGFSLDISLANAIVSMYCNCGDLFAGKSVFDDMPEKGIVSWNALLTGFRDHGFYKDVLVLFDRMMCDRKRPNHITLLSLLPACRSELQGKSVHGFAIRTEMTRETPVLTSLMFMYSRFNNIRLCLVLFQTQKNDDIALWNAAMSVLTHAKNPKKTVALFSSLLRMGLEPDNFTVHGLISACIQKNSLKFACSVASYLLRKGLDKEVTISNGLIDMYAKCGDISAARMIFDHISRKDGVTWSVMINGYGIHGDGKAALDLFSWMEISGLKVDSIAYSAILSACSHSGLAKEGLKVFDSMLDRGVSRGPEHYACAVDLLARTGRLREAYGIVEAMPFEPPASLLEALLGGCSAYGNVDIGAEIGGKLVKSDPENPGLYVMLHNMYASAGRWDDAERVRDEIEKRRLRKVPGFSLYVEEGTWI